MEDNAVVPSKRKTAFWNGEDGDEGVGSVASSTAVRSSPPPAPGRALFFGSETESSALDKGSDRYSMKSDPQIPSSPPVQTEYRYLGSK
jgi:hypothetical protein